MPRALKVYRTPIGFHDAYVAAPSQKAALEAWATDKNLFARGAAELVTDPKLTQEPLASPGKVIKRTRGDLSDHLAAARKSATPARRKAAAEGERKTGKPAPAPPPAPRKPKPPPSRSALAKAEAALAAFETEAEKEVAALRERESRLRAERERLQRRQRAEGERLAEKLARARESYSAAIERWSAED